MITSVCKNPGAGRFLHIQGTREASMAGGERLKGKRAKILQDLVEQVRDFSLNPKSNGKPLEDFKMKTICFSLYL